MATNKGKGDDSFRFVRAPLDLITDSEVSDSAFRFWCVFKLREWLRLSTDPAEIAESMGVTERSAQRWMSNLSACGWGEWNRKAEATKRFRTKNTSELSPEQQVLADIRQALEGGATLEELQTIFLSHSDKIVATGDETTKLSHPATNGSHETTKLSHPATNGSHETTKLSHPATNGSSRKQFHGVTKPKKRGLRSMRSIQTHEIDSDPLPPASGGDGFGPVGEYLLSLRITPTKVRQILAAHPDLDLDAVRAAAEEMREHNAGPGAIAESLLASPPQAKAAGEDLRATPENRERYKKLLGYDPYGEER